MVFKLDKNFNDITESQYFHVLTRGVIIDGDYILAAKAKNADNTFLPGGHLEFNENLKNALQREIKEEMGMDCTINEYIGCVESSWDDSEIEYTVNSIYNQEINHIFLVGGIKKHMEIKSLENHLEFFWMKISDMEKENLLPYSMRKIIEGVYNNKRINYISEI